MDGRTIALLIDSFWQILLPGLTVTIPLTAISFLFGLIIALFTALVQIAHVHVLDQLARFYVWVIRGTPLLVQLFVIFYGLPSLGVTLDAFPSAIIVFSINTGAYAAETMRAAILSVPKGQMEAGYCAGMSCACMIDPGAVGLFAHEEQRDTSVNRTTDKKSRMFVPGLDRF